MKKYLGWLIPIVVIGIVVIVLVLIPKPSTEDEEPMGWYGGIPESIVAYATSSTGETIYAGAVFLNRIIVGLDETDNAISIADTTADDSSVAAFFDIQGDTLQGDYEIGARLHKGIFYTASTTSNTTFIFIPM